jgi:hypothetical protein
VTLLAPEVGQATRVLNRRAMVRAFEPYDSRSGSRRPHVVGVEYRDDRRYLELEHLFRGSEAIAIQLETTALPGVCARGPRLSEARRRSGGNVAPRHRELVP